MADVDYQPAKIPCEKVQDAVPINLGRMNGADQMCSKYFPYDKKLARALLADKHIVFIGDSLTRGMYKDLLGLIKNGDLSSPESLRKSNETSIHGDQQMDIVKLEANRVFQQAREFQSNRHLIQFFFTSRAMRNDLEKTLMFFEETEEKPDIVVMNSCIWDVSRYHLYLEQDGMALVDEMKTIEDFLNRVAMFCRRMRALLAPGGMMIWILMPVVCKSEMSDTTRGFMTSNRLGYHEIRMRQMEANRRAAQVVKEAGFDVLDLEFHFRVSSFYRFRVQDGVHWNVVATRFMNQLLLGALTNAWGLESMVIKKWKGMKITDLKTLQQEKYEAVNAFLSSMNEKRREGDEKQQSIRMASLTTYESENEKKVSNAIKAMRMLMLFYELDTDSFNQRELMLSAFANQEIDDSFMRLDSTQLEELCEKADKLTTVDIFQNFDTKITHINPKRRLSRNSPEGPSRKRRDYDRSPISSDDTDDYTSNSENGESTDEDEGSTGTYESPIPMEIEEALEKKKRRSSNYVFGARRWFTKEEIEKKEPAPLEKTIIIPLNDE